MMFSLERAHEVKLARDRKRLARFLESLSANSEIFGVFGRGFPTSFYKVWVRATVDSRPWWRFERDYACPESSRFDPFVFEAALPIHTRCATLWASLLHLPDYTHACAGAPDFAPVLARLFARARLLKESA